MTKLARTTVRAWKDDNVPIDIPCDPEIGLMLDCEMIRPPSSHGQRVVVQIPPEQLVGLHQLVKREMRRQRSTPMSQVTNV